MRLNEFNTLLTNGAVSTIGRSVAFQPRLSPDASTVQLLNTIFKFENADYKALCADKLIQAVLQSDMWQTLETMDALNTYDRPLVNPWVFSYTASASNWTILDEGLDAGLIRDTFQITADTTTGYATVSSPLSKTRVVQFEVLDNLTTKIYLAPGIYARGASLDTGANRVTLTVEVPVRRGIYDILTDVADIYFIWLDADRKNIFDSSKDPIARAATFTIEMYYRLLASEVGNG